MKATNMSTPGVTLAATDGATAAVTIPIAMVASAPIERRAIIIGRVKVIALATLAYAGHEARIIKPATVAAITQTANPAITPRTFFAIDTPLE
jgi:hypothetical protein